MTKKLLLITLTILLLLTGIGLLISSNKNTNIDKKESEVVSPIAKKVKDLNVFGKYNESSENDSIQNKSDLENNDVFSILLLGIDRRSKLESAFRTDIMLLITINKVNNSVTLTSVPRDLWHGDGRINALYIQQGWEEMQTAFGQITGQTPQRYILTDFEDFEWIVDQMGGVPVDVETTFTDSQYPIDETKEYQTISFTQGKEILTGERALIFARSRKGDNDNGDWGRMRRQHLILKGMLEAVTQPQSFVCKDISLAKTGTTCAQNVTPKTLENIYNLVTTNKMEANLKIGDLEYLWDFYSERKSYEINSLIMDYEYLFTPPANEYGGAWVLAPINGSYEEFKHALVKTINKDIDSAEVAPDL